MKKCDMLRCQWAVPFLSLIFHHRALLLRDDVSIAADDLLEVTFFRSGTSFCCLDDIADPTLIKQLRSFLGYRFSSLSFDVFVLKHKMTVPDGFFHSLPFWQVLWTSYLGLEPIETTGFFPRGQRSARSSLSALVVVFDCFWWFFLSVENCTLSFSEGGFFQGISLASATAKPWTTPWRVVYGLVSEPMVLINGNRSLDFLEDLAYSSGCRSLGWRCGGGTITCGRHPLPASYFEGVSNVSPFFPSQGIRESSESLLPLLQVIREVLLVKEAVVFLSLVVVVWVESYLSDWITQQRLVNLRLEYTSIFTCGPSVVGFTINGLHSSTIRNHQGLRLNPLEGVGPWLGKFQECSWKFFLFFRRGLSPTEPWIFLGLGLPNFQKRGSDGAILILQSWTFPLRVPIDRFFGTAKELRKA